jgi:SAM-dependent methyltransferase
MAGQHEILWENYHRSATARGELIRQVAASFVQLRGCHVLDVGCGHGGAAIALARAGSEVTALDIDAGRLGEWSQAAGDEGSIEILCQPVEALSAIESFDLIILWDVLEHLSDLRTALSRLHGALRPGGRLLIATPNRQALPNLIADPHYGLPLISLCRRRALKKIIGGWLRWHPVDKPDYPELLSWPELEGDLRAAGFSVQLINRLVVVKALEIPAGLWNRPWHLLLINWLKARGLQRWVRRAAVDSAGPIARRLQPTFYLIGQKNAPVAPA